MQTLPQFRQHPLVGEHITKLCLLTSGAHRKGVFWIHLGSSLKTTLQLHYVERLVANPWVLLRFLLHFIPRGSLRRVGLNRRASIFASIVI